MIRDLGSAPASMTDAERKVFMMGQMAATRGSGEVRGARHAVWGAC
jgi:hypothetical protein